MQMINPEEIKDLINLVDELNYAIFLKQEEGNSHEEYKGTVSYELHTNGYGTVIMYCGLAIWNSEEDSREFLETINDYESMRPFILKKTRELIREMLYTIPKENSK